MSVRLLSLIVALVVLGGAVGYAAIMGSPYDTVKKALLDALYYTNVTIEGEAVISINGMVFEIEKIHNIVDDNGSLSYSYGPGGETSVFFYNSEGLNVNGYADFWGGDTPWYSASIYQRNAGYSRRTSYGMLNVDERDSAQMRFMELLVDVLVGDLKNNVTMSSKDGIRIIQGTLTESQIPELVKAGIDVLVEQQGRWFYDWRDVSFDGEEYISEHIRIENGMKTVTTYKQAVRPMTEEEQNAWDDGTYN